LAPLPPPLPHADADAALQENVNVDADFDGGDQEEFAEDEDMDSASDLADLLAAMHNCNNEEYQRQAFFDHLADMASLMEEQLDAIPVKPISPTRK
jgi:hypothetical protein